MSLKTTGCCLDFPARVDESDHGGEYCAGAEQDEYPDPSHQPARVLPN